MDSLAKVVIWKFINSEDLMPQVVPKDRIITGIRIDKVRLIIFKLRNELKYQLPKLDVMKYWSDKEKLSFSVISNYLEDQEIFQYTVRNIEHSLVKWLTK